MGRIQLHAPVLPILAAFSRYDAALEWGLQRAVSLWGPVALASPRYEFAETDYYEPTMGGKLQKCFWAFERLGDPTNLVDWKLLTNRWEEEYAAEARHSESRPLNLDPGYLTPAKLVLASTKDHSHRLYLGQGIYGEVTLYFRDGRWQTREWTFADYRRADYAEFFMSARQWLRRQTSLGSG
jgi:Domain of unknown function (DUF4416)